MIKYVLAMSLFGYYLGAIAAPDETTRLEQQARMFWNAQVTGDWGRAYDLTSPEDRVRKASRADFIKFRNEQGPLIYVSADIGAPQVQGDTGWVFLRAKVRPKELPRSEPMTTEAWETWYRKGSGWYPLPKELRDDRPALPPSSRPAADEAVLSTRVKDFWDAKRSQDWERVYRFLEPDFRSHVSRELFLQRKPKVQYLSHAAEWIEVTNNSGRVKTRYSAKPADPSLSKMEPTEEVFVEQWVKVNGYWYLKMASQ